MNIQQQLNMIAAKSKRTVEQVNRSALWEVGNRIIIRSPVDSGAFKSNWLGAAGQPDNSIVSGDTDPSGKLKVQLDNLTLGQTFFFTNPLPYGQRLEDGWSEKAAQGMVKISVAEWPQIVESIGNQAK